MILAPVSAAILREYLASRTFYNFKIILNTIRPLRPTLVIILVCASAFVFVPNHLPGHISCTIKHYFRETLQFDLA